jgi:hypothetical protein
MHHNVLKAPTAKIGTCDNAKQVTSLPTAHPTQKTKTTHI